MPARHHLQLAVKGTRRMDDAAKKEIALWAGVPLLLLIVYSVSFDSSAEIDKRNRTLKQKAEQYSDYYLNPKATVTFDEALAENNQQLEEQQQEFERIIKRAMPGLPPVYRTSNYTKASAQATADLAAVRKLAERTGVSLPSSLPNADALDTDPVKFSQQLAELYLFRQSLEMLIRDAASGKLNVTGLAINNKSGFTDQSGAIAVYLLDITAQIDFRSLERTLRNFNNNPHGIAVRMFDAEVPDRKRINNDVPYMVVNMTLSLAVPNDERWAFKPLGEARAEAAGGRGGRGSRF